MIENKEYLIIRELKYLSPDYISSLELRDKVLRKPLGLCLFDENLENEKNDVHIGAFINNHIVGILILTRQNAMEIKMRQVAVDEVFRNKKTGSKLVFYAEEYSTNNGYLTMILNARKTAVGFYEKMGYEKISDEFLELNIPHYKMSKRIVRD